MLPVSRATILGPPEDWGEEKLSPPSFTCLLIETQASRAPFIASALIHVLVVLCLPIVLRLMPQERGEVVRARLMPHLQATLILRMPNRIYLPMRGTLLPDASTASAALEHTREQNRPARNGMQSRGTSSSNVSSKRQALPLPILIQPGKPINADPRTLRLPSLLYLSSSQTPAPPRPVVPGVNTPPPPSPKVPAEVPRSLSPPQHTAQNPKPEAPGIPATPLALPTLPRPSPWALVLQGGGGETPDQGVKTESGADVAVLSIATAPPRAGQVVEVPPVNQPAVLTGAAASGPAPEPRGERRQAVAAGNATSSSTGGKNAASTEGAQEQGGNATARGQARTDTPSGGDKLGSQAAAGVPGPIRTRVTALGRVQILDLPDGAQQWQFPSGGSFDVVIVQPSPGATIPDAEQLLTGRPVQTVYLTLGTGQDWVLQYCLPATRMTSSQSGMVVTLGQEPKLDAPFIQRAFVPPQRLLQGTQPALFQATLDVNGRFASLHPVMDANYRPGMELLPYLEQWQFRPAKLDRVPVEVEILLLVPSPVAQ